MIVRDESMVENDLLATGGPHTRDMPMVIEGVLLFRDKKERLTPGLSISPTGNYRPGAVIDTR